MWVTEGRPSVRVPVLSTTRVLTFSIRSSASAFLMRTPICAPRPTPTMMETGVASPSAHGQAMMRTATATTRACASRGSGPTIAHTANATTAMAMTTGTKTAATRSAIRWMGARERCASATICTMRASIVSRPTFSATMTSAPVWLMVPPMTVSPVGLGGRHRLTGHQGLIDRGASFFDRAVDRHLLARTDPQPVAELNLVQGHFFVGAVGTDPSGRLRAQVEQRLDRTRGLFTGA